VPDGPPLRQDDTGEDVRRLQRLLVMLGRLPYDALTGRFDPATTFALRQFQRSTGLADHGEADAATWAALPPEPATVTLRPGDEGDAVVSLQAGLTEVRGPGEDTDPGPADGYFGENTELAVRAYQIDRAITVDGEVGDETWWVPAGPDGTTLAALALLTTVPGPSGPGAVPS
jgi:peptidoglycan hydrolase-like protein with peptidoglycan-binding domain